MFLWYCIPKLKVILSCLLLGPIMLSSSPICSIESLAEVAPWPTPEGTIEIRYPEIQQSHRLSYRFRKRGRDLFLFVHGLGCSQRAFEPAWAHKALKDYSLLSLDLLGFGLSDRPAEFSYTIESHAAYLEAIIMGLIQSGFRVHFIGNSMGPLVALAMSSQAQSSLTSLVNVEGRLFFEDCGNSAKVASSSYDEFLGQHWEALCHREAGEPTAYDLWRALPKAFYEGAISVTAHAREASFYETFLKLPAKKIYVHGDQARSRSMRVLAELNGKVPLQEVSRAGHFVMWDNPDEFYSFLANWITPCSLEPDEPQRPRPNKV